MAGALGGLATPGDPYRRAMERMRGEVVVRGGKSTFFFKTGAHGPRDVLYRQSGSFLRRFYGELSASGFEIGLHPSYHAYNHGRYLREEKAALRHASGVRAVAARTHYLRFDPRETPRLLAETGFQIDSSVGFAETTGFRRGSCLPFPLYDLDADEALDLWEMPLTAMESALFNREDRHLDEALDRTNALMDECRRHQGVFVGLWHNILWDEIDVPGWGEHFVRTLDRAATGEARMDTLRSTLDYWK